MNCIWKLLEKQLSKLNIIVIYEKSMFLSLEREFLSILNPFSMVIDFSFSNMYSIIMSLRAYSALKL